MTDKEIVNVVQAHIEGKQIQYYNENLNEWFDCADNIPCWDFGSFDYRVKPESKVRPYKDQDECWNDMQKHQPFGWIKIKDSSTYEFLEIIAKDTDFEFILKNHTYVDGSPFGVIEEE